MSPMVVIQTLHTHCVFAHNENWIYNELNHVSPMSCKNVI